ncbi:MAG: ferredoxin [Geminocystis sp.]|nr:ferredoxin [Geminocystis sp.]MCS7147019.1 ferredoxin [Geminocystis sp.]MDW8115843.1 ferredoxin [Geminocystis sp.]MDW8463386.1 ferredoxin [Geminocystis sp.]
MWDTENEYAERGLAPELGGIWREEPERSGFEPELGGNDRIKGVYVDEAICIGCKHCAHVAPNTFHIESEYGRSRVYNQNGDPVELIQEAIDTCPVDCIHWLDFTEIKRREEERKNLDIRPLGFPQHQKSLKRPKKNKSPDTASDNSRVDDSPMGHIS